MNQSPIFVKTDAFILWLLQRTVQFPKNERFRLARRIEDAAFDLHELLIRAVQNERPLSYLQEAAIELTKLRTYIRWSMESAYISQGQYGYAAQQITEIGNLLGGWKKTVKA